jgi:hypothetical protein
MYVHIWDLYINVGVLLLTHVRFDKDNLQKFCFWLTFLAPGLRWEICILYERVYYNVSIAMYIYVHFVQRFVVCMYKSEAVFPISWHAILINLVYIDWMSKAIYFVPSSNTSVWALSMSNSNLPNVHFVNGILSTLPKTTFCWHAKMSNSIMPAYYL